MCRPSCCSPSSGEGVGILAVAAAAAVVVAAVKIGPVVARTFHIIVHVLAIAAVTAGASLAGAVLAWLAVRIARWHCRRSGQRNTGRLARYAVKDHVGAASSNPACVACGGKAVVLRADSAGGGYRSRPCPECQPARLAG
jgi:hypothetical protein